MNTEALSTQYEMNRAYIESSTTPPKDGSFWRTVKGDWMHECSHCGEFTEGNHMLTRFVGEENMPQSLIDGYRKMVDEGMEHDDDDPIYALAWIQTLSCDECGAIDEHAETHIDVYGGYHCWYGTTEFFNGFGPWEPVEVESK